VVLVPSPEKDRTFRQQLADEQRTKFEEKHRQDEAKRIQEEEERRIAAENERKREEERRLEEERKREEERQAELRRLYEVRHQQEKQENLRLDRMIEAQQEFTAPEIVEPGASATFVYVMGVILILAGIVAGIWGIAEAADKGSVLPFIIGTVLLLQCFLVAAFFFLACGVAHNIFYICKNLEHYSRRWQDGKGGK
jgi:hypothetical protein